MSYYNDVNDYKNPLTASFVKARQTLLEDHMMHYEQGGEYEGGDSTTQKDELAMRMEEELEQFLQSFVKNGLTIRGEPK